MFITLLCIMFDIKDYAADHNEQLKTFVVEYGLRRTIFYILIPLAAIGLGTFVLYAAIRHFPLLRILVNTIPFILLIIVAYSMHRRKNILYYLAIIDGLMLVKALCGIAGISLIK
jgi:4-hydroxybenzoate polyprenyltransferase